MLWRERLKAHKDQKISLMFWNKKFGCCRGNVQCSVVFFSIKPLRVGQFLVRDVIYTYRAYAMMSVSICLSVCLWQKCIVVTGCNGSRIPLHAWIDGCLCYLLTTPHPDRRMGWCLDFWRKRGGMEKLVIVVISLILLTESLDRKQLTALFISTMFTFLFFSNLGRKCIISEERLVLELPTSRVMLATARPSCTLSTCILYI